MLCALQGGEPPDLYLEPDGGRPLFGLRRESNNAVGGLVEMRDSLLWRKLSHITMMLSEALQVDAETALDLLYSTKTYIKLVEPRTGLQLMSDSYILEDILKELNA